MSDTTSIAEKAARDLLAEVLRVLSIPGPVDTLKATCAERIQVAIDEATVALVTDCKSAIRLEVKKVLAEKQEQIDKMFTLLDEERQAVVLAMVHLAWERPGWRDWLSRIAATRLRASAMYEELFSQRTSTPQGGTTR